MNAQALDTLPYRYAKAHQLLLGEATDEHQEVFYCNSTPLFAINEIHRQCQQPLKLTKLSTNEFELQLAEQYQMKAEMTQQLAADIGEEVDVSSLLQSMPRAEDLLESHDDAPIIRLLNALLTQAIKQRASDIHVETFERQVMIRFRIDGVLREVVTLPRSLAPMIISRLKVMAKLDIAEKRMPQDGRISLTIAGNQVDVRVSTIPASHAERVVLRILDKQAAHLDLSKLGMNDEALNRIEKLIAQPHGIILITGPTGSGKTTSLYAMLSDLNEMSRNILTVEDPIEYDLPGIGQMQVNTKIDMSFAKGLRAILRQDPDIVMVGEIRDLETAEIAVQASLTGHLVFSTLHTNTALGAIARLRDMGVEPFLLSSSLIGLLAQRLVRRLCQSCCEARPLNDDDRHYFERSPVPDVIYDAKGCEACNQAGYQGRTGIYELIVIDSQLRTMIHHNDAEQAMEKILRTTTPSIRDDGLNLVREGLTTIAEVLRVTREE